MRTLKLQKPALYKAILVIAALAMTVGACSNSDDSDDTVITGRQPNIAAAEFEGPITTGSITLPTDFREFDVATVGYVQEEWFASGTATAYVPVGELGRDGRWDTQPASTAAYRTRIVVRRPGNPSDWNGDVVMEWLNVSGPFETPAEWSYTSRALVDAGAVYVALSAQAIGIVGGDPLLSDGERTLGIRDTNPERYGSLVHPGDAYSYDIAAQIGAALRSSAGAAALGGRPAERMILSGESQSASFLVTFINAVQPVANVYDGFFVHSRGHGASGLDGALNIASDSANLENGVLIRDDLDAPVLIFETETDITVLRYAAARQEDSDTIRTWEVAGTSHADAYYLGFNFSGCGAPINNGPHHFVVKAGMAALLHWVAQGETPPRGERIQTTGEGGQTVIARNALGIAVGGIRTPSVDVPVATLTGDPSPGGPGYCRLFGASHPFDEAALTSLYGTQANYLESFEAALDKAVEAGFVRPEDADDYRNESANVSIP
jgi:hypothetical protein